MTKESIYMLDAQRKQAERLVKIGCAENINMHGIREVANVEFGMRYTRHISYSNNHYDEMCSIINDTYAKYDQWKLDQIKDK